MKTYISTIALLAALSACTTATIPTTPVAPGDPATISQEELDTTKAEISDAVASFIAGNTILTPDMPTAGAATYAGSLILSDGIDSGYAVVGDLALDADFAGATITGSAANFNSVDITHGEIPIDPTIDDLLAALVVDSEITLGTAVMGELLLDGDIGEFADAEFLASLTGELIGLGLDEEEVTMIIDAMVGGAFITSDGSGADAVFGFIEGTGTSGDTSFDIGGGFFADLVE